MALDLYAWLAYRLHALGAERPIGRAALRSQFGVGFARMRDFRPVFAANLRLALAVYPAAKVDMNEIGVSTFGCRPRTSIGSAFEPIEAQPPPFREGSSVLLAFRASSLSIMRPLLFNITPDHVQRCATTADSAVAR